MDMGVEKQSAAITISQRIGQRLLPGWPAALLCVLCWPLNGDAAEKESTEHPHAEKNEVAISVSLVHEGHENDGAAGLEYERRFTEKFGAGLLVERVWGNHDATVYALPLIRHAGRWKFFLAPGFEDSHGHSEDLVRLGAGYEFEAGSARIVPTMAVDFVGGETVYVLSVALGMGF